MSSDPKEQLAGLVDKWRAQANGALRRSGTWNGNDVADRIEFMADDLAAILDTLPEPGVVSDEAVGVAWDAGAVASGCAGQEMLPEDAAGMRAALEAALPHLAPAAPAGEARWREDCPVCCKRGTVAWTCSACSHSTFPDDPPAEARPVVDEAWRLKASEWLEAKAREQEANNARWPEHAAAYQGWRDRPVILRLLATEVMSAAALAAAAKGVG